MAESQPTYATTVFNVHKGGDCVTYREDVNILMAISGLKFDYEDQFGIPADQQVWKHNDEVLDDNKSFRQQGLYGDVTIDVYQKTYLA